MFIDSFKSYIIDVFSYFDVDITGFSPENKVLISLVFIIVVISFVNLGIKILSRFWTWLN